MTATLEELVHEHEALNRWNAGEAPSFSSSIADTLTCGYGNISEYGNFQFPLYPAEDFIQD